jgi:hypothetical protein
MVISANGAQRFGYATRSVACETMEYSCWSIAVVEQILLRRKPNTF